ncbi:MAG: hypothetical protein GEU80_07130 [Dehalococcoidia bacterium]|nr:hypothetical protein [Dehalococcoidia bacterium]
MRHEPGTHIPGFTSCEALRASRNGAGARPPWVGRRWRWPAPARPHRPLVPSARSAVRSGSGRPRTLHRAAVPQDRPIIVNRSLGSAIPTIRQSYEPMPAPPVNWRAPAEGNPGPQATQGNSSNRSLGGQRDLTGGDTLMTVDVEQVKRRHPIADAIAAHGVELRPRGGRLTGRCPFHEDRDPSLVVYPDTRSFHCFGCGASGDVIDFVRRAEGIGFREAVDRLGEGGEAQSPAPRSEPRPHRLTLDDRLILTAACELYHETLLRTPGIGQYLETRGVPTWVARHCRLGFSDGRLLVPYLKRRRLSLRRAAELGLLFADGAETMTGRVLIPDQRGSHCGWMVGRALDGRQEPRYRGLSLPRPLLGYERTRGHRRVFLTEGPFDWLTLVGWGLPACALLGTQPGRDTLRLLGRARSVVLVLDGDDAGREATTRLAETLGERARVVELPHAVKDVSELGVQPDGRETFFSALDEAERRARDVATAR